ncbi:MAG: ferrous iron transporter B [Elusimicrobia bacterium]|nr:ferrous iron transporter B [Elusimicrobiota bacterium]
MKIILTGNPNVGKSVVFSRLTNIGAVSSNYPGTTVEILLGKAKLAGETFDISDVPGAYSLGSDNEAERIAAEVISSKQYDLIIHVLDATALERNLFFSFSIIESQKPVIFLLNKSDLAKNKGIYIDPKKLSSYLGVKVLPIIATTGEGFEELNSLIKSFISNSSDFIPVKQFPKSEGDKWKIIGEISRSCQRIEHKHPGLAEKLEIMTSTPNTALPFAAAVIISSFFIIRFIGENLINYVLDPLFSQYYMPLILKIKDFNLNPLIQSFLLGKTLSPTESFGILTTGIYIPFVTVLPYIFSFYLILSLTEDIGYLPRLAVILDRFSHKIGLHGYGTIPLIMGLGCKVPGILSLRILETRKEKIIAASLLFLFSPCMPQTAMIFSILSPFPIKYTFLVFGYLFILGMSAGFILNKIIKQETPELFMEIPPYQIPSFKMLIFKLKIRLKEFIKDAVPMIIFGVALINILDISGSIEKITSFFSPVFSRLLNLPGEMGALMAIGFLKKDVSIAMLAPFNLTASQLVTASVFLVSYMPCAASLFVLRKELGIKNFFAAVSFNFIISLFFTWLLSAILNF